MSGALLRDLAWLPRPGPDWKSRVRGLAPSTPQLGEELQALAAAGLDLNHLSRLASSVRTLREAGADLAPLIPLRLGVLSNATTQLIAPALVASALRHGIALQVIESPYDQIVQSALDPGSEVNRAAPDAVLLALDERALPLDAEPGADTDSVVRRCLEHVDMLRRGVRAASGAPCIVPTLARAPAPLFGSLDVRLAGTRRRSIDAFNLALGPHLADSDDLLLDVAGLAESLGLAAWHDPVQWHLAKLPFAPDLVPVYADHVARLLAALRGRARRCLVLDLDNTLWGGVVADDGVEGLMLGQGDPVGEAHLELQRTALALRERGVVLAVCSKNSDANARAPFRTHPDMLLRESHVAVFQANFEDKASNLCAIARALDLGTDALVFVDDNPAERALVRATLPEVAVPELPDDPAYYARTLLAAGYFEAIAFSAEDRARAGMYRANAERAVIRERVADLATYLRDLDMEIAFAPFDALGRERITQLINKSNQFNLTTRRYTAAEVRALEDDPGCYTLQARLTDRFGDNGMISVVICRKSPGEWSIDTWLMSCRVLGRRVEEAMLAEIVRAARRDGAKRLRGSYRPTARNGLVCDHYARLGFDPAPPDEPDATHWELRLDSYVEPDLPLRVRSATTSSG